MQEAMYIHFKDEVFKAISSQDTITSQHPINYKVFLTRMDTHTVSINAVYIQLIYCG